MDCKRCGQTVKTCTLCKGTGQYSHPLMPSTTCTECDGKGSLCPKDGKHWD